MFFCFFDVKFNRFVKSSSIFPDIGIHMLTYFLKRIQYFTQFLYFLIGEIFIIFFSVIHKTKTFSGFSSLKDRVGEWIRKKSCKNLQRWCCIVLILMEDFRYHHLSFKEFKSLPSTIQDYFEKSFFNFSILISFKNYISVTNTFLVTFEKSFNIVFCINKIFFF